VFCSREGKAERARPIAGAFAQAFVQACPQHLPRKGRFCYAIALRAA
jgi:hypothetical protein